MRRVLPIAMVPLLLFVAACGTDDRAPAASLENSPSPVTVSVTPTVMPTETPISTPVTPSEPTPTVAPTAPRPTATASCVTPAEQNGERIEEWPDPSEFMSAIIGAFPWDVPGVPDDIPTNPEFHLLDGMDVPTDITGDGPVTFSITARNSYDESIAFEMRGNPGYDFAVISAAGEVVWLYSDHMDVESGPNFLELEPDESRELTATWDLTGPDGVRVEDGLYFVVGIMFREEPEVELEQQFVYIGERPSLEESLEVRLSAPPEVKCGGVVTMTLEVTNITGSPLRIGTGVDFDNYFAFTSDDSGEREEVWNWWTAQGGWIRLVELVPWLPPGETATFTRSWELKDLSDNHVPPGKYQLQASFRAAQKHGITGPDGTDETLWSNIVEITVTE